MTNVENLISENQTNKTILVKWFWNNYVRSYIGFLFVALIFMTIEGSMMGLLSYSVKMLFDNVLVSGVEEDIWMVGFVIFFIFSSRALSGLCQRLLVSHVGQKIAKALQSNLVKHMLKLDTEFFYRNAPGLLIERVRGDSQKITEMLSLVLMTIGRDGIALLSLIIVSAVIDWRWSLVAFIGTPILIIPILLLQTWIRSVAIKSRNADAENTTRLDEIFHGINAIKLNGIEEYESDRLDKVLNFTQKIKFKMEAGMAGMPAIIDIVAACGFFAVMVFGGREIISGQKSVGDFMSFFTAMALIFEPLRRLSNVSGSAQVAFASIDKVHSIFSKQPKIENHINVININKLSPKLDISFENISFSYESSIILSDVNFRCEPGKILAIVGPSGAGKTTILNLIPRLIDPLEGSIFFGGRNIKDIDLKELRNLISVVSQESSLFDDTIRENIVLGFEMSGDHELNDAIRDSFVDEFLFKLPKGLDTLVGPRGVNLSGGQRQRILIARALFRNKPILLLDEPTSALDSQSEAMIQTALNRLSKGRTTIVVAHRISTIMNADNILVLKSGQVVEQGKHQELLKNKSYYLELVNTQLFRDGESTIASKC